MTLVYVALAMACSDILGTSLVIAEAHGNSFRAGILDALSDVSGLVYLALGVKALSQWNWHSLITLGVICSTSFVTTALTTRIESRANITKVGALPIDLTSGADVT